MQFNLDSSVHNIEILAFHEVYVQLRAEFFRARILPQYACTTRRNHALNPFEPEVLGVDTVAVEGYDGSSTGSCG